MTDQRDEQVAERLARLPNALRSQTVFRHLSGARVPALLAHPDAGWMDAGARPAARPVVLWMHGRTVNKELDPGRYLRWQRAGIAACAIDLPGHGERLDEAYQQADHTLMLAEQCAGEIDGVVAALSAPEFNGAFDLDRVAIGGMSAGGIVALVRLCRPHRFRAVAVEATTGDFAPMRGRAFFVEPWADRLNPIEHLENWAAIPFLALHSEADEWIPVGAMRSFVGALRERYGALGADPAMIEMHTWPKTGAPYEHYGFGRVSNEAKNLQTEFLARHLGASPAVES